ncbi:GntR family transcriptional regulator [Cupriavidus sp. AcVe19-6a]|uniref:GntR family transcriptional regulator n=1 Tax=Cupriavidus sp. AcVe19-6a TaxID=2821358 RepID=UPI001AE8F3A7|nr:GntR family transcriptional regulator [Cupriavidus sp. AcVe19-6a]
MLRRMPLNELVTPLTRQTLSRDVYTQLRELLITGQMMPGEQISLRNIAAALGVSVMPVREAVHRLVAEQALELTPNRALRVPRMSVSQFEEITKIRIQLEGLATATAAERITDAELARVESLRSRFAAEMSKDRPDGAAVIAANQAFHFAVYAAARMPILLQMIESQWLRIGPILNHDLRSGSRRVDERVAVKHHDKLVEALRGHDSEAACAALRGDIESAAAYIVSAGVLVNADGIGPAAAMLAPVQRAARARPKAAS